MRQPYSIPRGIRPSAVLVHIVCGAPGSGKSTYAKENAKPGDFIIDFDDIRKAVGVEAYDNDPATLRLAFQCRDTMLHTLADMRRGEAWLTITAPTKDEREAWGRALGKVQLHVMGTPADECKRRIENDSARPSGHVERLLRAVDNYFAEAN